MSEARKYADFLQNLKGISAGWTDRLKIRYRPYICPFDFIIDTARSADSVFDIGCGNGQLMFLLDAFAGPGKKIKGIEISEKLVEQAKDIYTSNVFSSSMVFEKYNGKELPDDIGEFDLITMVDVLHHIPLSLQTEILTQVFHKMKSGSFFLLKDIDADSFWVIFNKLHDRVLSGETGNERGGKKVRDLCQSLGFEIKNFFYQRTLWYPHYFILMQKP